MVVWFPIVLVDAGDIRDDFIFSFDQANEEEDK